MTKILKAVFYDGPKQGETVNLEKPLSHLRIYQVTCNITHDYVYGTYRLDGTNLKEELIYRFIGWE